LSVDVTVAALSGLSLALVSSASVAGVPWRDAGEKETTLAWSVR
jgi:hypothetical protein